MTEQIIKLINSSKLSKTDYTKIINHCKYSAKDDDDNDDCESDDDDDNNDDNFDFIAQHIMRKKYYLAEFVTSTKLYFDRLDNTIQQHIEINFEDFSCSLSFSGNKEGYGHYSLKLKRNNRFIFIFHNRDLFDFENEDLTKYEIYKLKPIQKIVDDYGYDSNILLIKDVIELLLDLMIDDYIVRNSDPGAYKHFG